MLRALQKWRKSCSPSSAAAAARMAATSRLPSWTMKYLRAFTHQLWRLYSGTACMQALAMLHEAAHVTAQA